MHENKWVSGIKDVAEALYAELDMCVTFVTTPFARAEKLLREGTIDAQLIKVGDYIDVRDYALKVEPYLYFLTGHLLTLGNKSGKDLTKGDLKNMKILGVQEVTWHQQVCQKYGCILEVVPEIEFGVKMVERGRAAGVLMTHSSVRKNLETQPQIMSKLVVSETVYKMPLYHVLGKHNEHLLPRLNEAMLKVQKSKPYKDMLAQLEHHMSLPDGGLD